MLNGFSGVREYMLISPKCIAIAGRSHTASVSYIGKPNKSLGRGGLDPAAISARRYTKKKKKGTLLHPSRTNDNMVFRSFAVIGAGHIGSFIVEELLRLKAVGTVSSVTVVSRSVGISRCPCSHLCGPDLQSWMCQGCKHFSP